MTALAIEIANGWIPLGQPGVSQTIMAVVLFALSFPLLGWIILRRDPWNRLGWVYAAIGFWQAVNMSQADIPGRAGIAIYCSGFPARTKCIVIGSPIG